MKAPWRIAVLVAGVSALLVVTCLLCNVRNSQPPPKDSGAARVAMSSAKFHVMLARKFGGVVAQPVGLMESLSPGAKELAFAMSAGVWSTMRGDWGLFGGDRSPLPGSMVSGDLRRRGPWTIDELRLVAAQRKGRLQRQK